VTSACESRLCSISTLTTPPEVGLTSRTDDRDGRRRSASIKITSCPVSASDDARLTAVVLFPSLADGPVTRITWAALVSVG
jgi:hypothetical protein